MDCIGCMNFKAELASQKVFISQWFGSFHSQIKSMESKFEDVETKSMEFRKEILEKFDGLRSDVLTIAKKSGENMGRSFETHESAPFVDIFERENLSNFGLPATQNSQLITPQLAHKAFIVESVSDGFTLDSSPNNNKMSCSEAHLSGVSKPDSWLLPPTCREETVVSASTAVSALPLDNLSGVSKPDSMVPTCPQVVDNGSIQNGSSTSALASASSFSLAKLELLDEEMNEEQVSVTSFVSATEFPRSTETEAMMNEDEEMNLFEHMEKDLEKRLEKKKCPPRLRTKPIIRVEDWKKKVHNLSGAVVCSVCGGTIKGCISHLEDHATRHLEKRPFQCIVCGFTFVRRRKAVWHARNTHPQNSRSPENLIAWTVDEKDYKGNVASKMAECFPNNASPMLSNKEKTFSRIKAKKKSGQRNLHPVLQLLNKKSGRAMEERIKKTITQAEPKELTSGDFSNSETAGCCLCGSLIIAPPKSKRAKLQQHAVVHLDDEKAFQCSKCGKKFNRQCVAVKHVQNLHSATKNAKDLVVWAVDKEDYMKKLALKTTECFPKQATNTFVSSVSDGFHLGSPTDGDKYSAVASSSENSNEANESVKVSLLNQLLETDDNEIPLSPLVPLTEAVIATEAVAAPTKYAEGPKTKRCLSSGRNKFGIQLNTGPMSSKPVLKHSRKRRITEPAKEIRAPNARANSNNANGTSAQNAIKISTDMTSTRNTLFTQNPSSCTICGATLNLKSRKSSKKRQHVKIHLDIRPYRCSTCGAEFRRTAQAHEHVRKFHPEITCIRDTIFLNVDKEDYLTQMDAKTLECFPQETVLRPYLRQKKESMFGVFYGKARHKKEDTIPHND